MGLDVFEALDRIVVLRASTALALLGLVAHLYSAVRLRLRFGGPKREPVEAEGVDGSRG